MKDARFNYAVVGAFVLAMLAALVVVVALLTGRTGTGDRYTTRLTNVTGLKYGTKVTYEGFAIGQIEDIEAARSPGATLFRLTLSVRGDWGIPEDSIARVTAPGMLAAPVLDIKAGKSQAMLAPGAEITGGASSNLMAVMGDVAAQVTDLTQTGLKPLLASLNARVEGLGSVMEEQVPQLMGNLISITANADRMTRLLSDKVVTDANATKMNHAIDAMADLAVGLKETRGRLDTVMAALEKSVGGNAQAMDQSLKDLRYTLQTVARHIDSITYNLEGTSRNVHEFSRQIRENPGVLLGGNRPTDNGPGRK